MCTAAAAVGIAVLQSMWLDIFWFTWAYVLIIWGNDKSEASYIPLYAD